jgi:hypothetical protein
MSIMSDKRTLRRNAPVTPNQIVDVSKTFIEVLQVVDAAQRLVRYNPGWNDIRVGEKHGLSDQQIGRLRRSMFGDTYQLKVSPKAPLDAVAGMTVDRIHSLAIALRTLNERVEMLTQHITALRTRDDELSKRMVALEVWAKDPTKQIEPLKVLD